MSGLAQDLRYVLRQCHKSPGVTAVAVITLAMGIGANTAIFSVMNAALLRYLPVPNPQQLVYLQTDGIPQGATLSGDQHGFNFATFKQLRSEHHVFSDLMAFVPLGWGKVPVRFGNQAEEATGDVVSGNFFTGLGVRAERGQTFTFDDELRHSPIVVLSYNYWTRRFSRNPSIIGQTIYVKSVPLTVVGIAARDFVGVEPGGETTDFWIPFQNDPKLNPLGDRGLYGSPNWWFLIILGRLQPRISWQRAIAELNPQYQRSAYDGIGVPHHGEEIPHLSFSATGGIEKLRSQGGDKAAIVVAMVAAVLLIACLNVAMLLIARNVSRQNDFSMRIALGASGWQLFRQLLTEALLLTLSGALLAWILALWTAPVLAAWAKLDISVAPDQTVLAFTLATALVVALALSLAPLPRAARANVGLTLKSLGPPGAQGRSSFRAGRYAVAIQIAMCLALLVATGLLIRTLRNLQTTDLGFRAAGILLFDITPPQARGTKDESVAFHRAFMEQLRALPSVESATVMSTRIGTGAMNSTDLRVDGAYPEGNGDFHWYIVGPDFCHVLGIPMLQGREFNDADIAGSAKHVFVNKTFADRYLHARNPLGHQIQVSPFDPATIIGIAADSKYLAVREEPIARAFLPYSPGTGTVTIALRAYGNPLALLPQVRGVAASFSPDMAVLQPTTLQAQFEDTYSNERMFAQLSLFFGLLAVLLVAAGLYGTKAQDVSRRTPEIGVRMALGAGRKEVLWMILRESLLICTIGVSAGLPLTFLAVRLMRSMLYQLSPFDPISFALAMCGVALITAVAGYISARRATKVDPMVALRYE